MSEAPMWFYFVALVALAWNIIGLLSFYARLRISSEAIAALPAEKQALFAPLPLWALVAFGIAVVCGTLGCVALLFRMDSALWLFIASFAGIVMQNINSIRQNAFAEQGVGAVVFASAIAIVALALIYFAWQAGQNGWLG